MKSSKKNIKKRLKITLALSFVVVVALILRLGYIQIYKNQDLKTGALEQWTKTITIRPKRGNVYDRKGRKLAISINSFTVWATPAHIKEAGEIEKTSKILSQVLKLDEDEIYEKLNTDEDTQKIKQLISREESTKLKDLNLKGITIVEDNKRYYPNGNFASYVLGFTDIDNKGLDGIEYIYNRYLTGVPGKLMKMTDGSNRQFPYEEEKIHKPEDGSSLVLTIDETIQQFAEKAVEKALIDTKAKNASVVMMEVDTGEILAMVSKPDFDPNNPRDPMDEKQKKEWEKLSSEDLQKKWYELWRNPIVSDVYEPGSTFKLITAAAVLEENSANLDSHYYCNGFVKDIKGSVIKCASWYNPHRDLTFREAMNTSCNVAFVNMGRKLGKEKFYKYIKGFGFGEKTNIDLLGEQAGIIPNSIENIKEINLATLSYGHGIAVTPIQLVTAISAIANGGDLLKPRIVKEVLNTDGDIVESFEPELIRKVISKNTSDQLLSLMETVVSDGSGSNSYIAGYKIGGKTGTSKKAVEGVPGYKDGKYIASFVAVAPADNPKIAMLVVVDEPASSIYGGTVAAPIAHSIFQDSFKYLGIQPKYSEKEKKKNEELVEVPDVRNKKIGDAGKILSEAGLKHITEHLELTNESIVLDQIPLPGEKLKKESIVDLYIDSKPNEEITIPSLKGKKKDEVKKILDKINLKYEFKGEGKAFKQKPLPGEKVKKGSKITIEFK